MEKPKRKRLDRLSFFISPRRFELVSSYPLEDCISRLESKDERGCFYSTRVSVNPVDEDTYEFSILRGDRTQVGARGYLKRWEEETTQVSGEAGITADFGIILVLFLVGALVLIGLGVSNGQFWRYCGGSLCFGFAAWLLWFIAKFQRDFAFYMIENTLNPSIKSK